ncbi:hypothetical protein Ciccas_001445 [Cichlidogyrus casuarinus]|uniref:Phospholipid scramblase n=1 Tax=Cichlidogyrus casuarinus TaxID=1844966 RepID=A0ABD2QJZ2_9PLAT
MDLKTPNNDIVLSLKKPGRCSANCGSCCAPVIVAKNPQNELFGTVKQMFGYCSNPFVIHDWLDRPQLIVRGPPFSCKACIDLILKVYVIDHETESIGRIVRRYSDQTDFYTLIFPSDLDLRMKIMLVCTALLIVSHDF